jgi:hypothetical protein
LLSDADAVAMWGSREMAVWSEAARQAECHLQYALFKSKAAAVDLDLSGAFIFFPSFAIYQRVPSCRDSLDVFILLPG